MPSQSLLDEYNIYWKKQHHLVLEFLSNARNGRGSESLNDLWKKRCLSAGDEFEEQ
jgi:hypothetical protein